MSAAISTTIDIEASPRAVWDVLIDFTAYPDWNPFMDRIEGTAEVGAKLVVHLAAQGGGRGMTFRPTVLVAPGAGAALARQTRRPRAVRRRALLRADPQPRRDHPIDPR